MDPNLKTSLSPSNPTIKLNKSYSNKLNSEVKETDLISEQIYFDPSINIEADIPKPEDKKLLMQQNEMFFVEIDDSRNPFSGKTWDQVAELFRDPHFKIPLTNKTVAQVGGNFYFAARGSANLNRLVSYSNKLISADGRIVVRFNPAENKGQLDNYEISFFSTHKNMPHSKTGEYGDQIPDKQRITIEIICYFPSNTKGEEQNKLELELWKSMVREKEKYKLADSYKEYPVFAERKKGYFTPPIFPKVGHSILHSNEPSNADKNVKEFKIENPSSIPKLENKKLPVQQNEMFFVEIDDSRNPFSGKTWDQVVELFQDPHFKIPLTNKTVAEVGGNFYFAARGSANSNRPVSYSNKLISADGRIVVRFNPAENKGQLDNYEISFFSTHKNMPHSKTGEYGDQIPDKQRVTIEIICYFPSNTKDEEQNKFELELWKSMVREKEKYKLADSYKEYPVFAERKKGYFTPPISPKRGDEDKSTKIVPFPKVVEESPSAIDVTPLFSNMNTTTNAASALSLSKKPLSHGSVLMNSALIPNLKELLKGKILEYLDDEKRYPLDKPEYAEYKARQDELVENLESMINIIAEGNIFENVTKIIQIPYISEIKRIYLGDSINNIVFEIECLEEGESIPTSIYINLIKNEENSWKLRTVNFIISSVYMKNLRNKSVPAVLPKDGGYFDHVKPIEAYSAAFEPYFKTMENSNEITNNVRRCFINFSEKKFEEGLKELILNFISNKEEKLLIIHDSEYDPKYLSNDYYILSGKTVNLCGIKLYKIPVFNYEDELQKIKKYSRSKDYQLFETYLYGLTSFEVSPDGFLEIYAGQLGFEGLFIDRIFNDEIDGDIDVEFDFKAYIYEPLASKDFHISDFNLGSVKNSTPKEMSRIRKFLKGDN